MPTKTRMRTWTWGWLVALFAAVPMLTACPSTPPIADRPTIVSFTAIPATIAVGESSTLSWTVNDATAIAISDGSNDVPFTAGDTSVDVTPEATTTYTLTATNAGGSRTATVTVTVTGVDPSEPAVIGSLQHEIVTGSRTRLTWTASNAAAIQVYAVDADDDAQPVGGTLSGSTRDATIDIPVAARQTIRVCAEAASFPDACAETTLTNVVTTAADWDPYDLSGFIAEEPIAGSLRSVMLEATPGSVVGFAADIDEVIVSGVDLEFMPELGGWQDGHLILREDVTISGPPGRVTLRGASGWEAPDPSDPFTWRSRIVFVMPGVAAELENLVLTEGAFIFAGAGIRNNGSLTVRNSVISDNRAWNLGGGIWNTSTGVLELVDSIVSGNRAASEVNEVGAAYAIRGDDVICVAASGFGGGLFNEGTATIRDTLFSTNEAVVSGGGIYNVGELSLENVRLEDNFADYVPYTDDPDFPDYPIFVDDPDCAQVDTFDPYSLGGGMYQGTTASFAGTDVLGNFVRDAGGGLFVDAASGSTLLSNLLIDFNVSQFGGGIQHEFFDGDDSNLTFGPAVSYGTSSNVPQDYLPNDRVGPAMVGAAWVGDAERGRYQVPASTIGR